MNTNQSEDTKRMALLRKLLPDTTGNPKLSAGTFYHPIYSKGDENWVFYLCLASEDVHEDVTPDHWLLLVLREDDYLLYAVSYGVETHLMNKPLGNERALRRLDKYVSSYLLPV